MGRVRATLQRAVGLGLSDARDWAFAEYLTAIAGRPDDDVLYLAAAAATNAVAHGHAYFDLAEPRLVGAGGQMLPVGRWPSAEEWQALPEACPAIVGTPASPGPLILDGSRLYLERYWRHEQRIARFIRDRTGERLPLDTAWLAERLHALFSGEHSPDWQAAAAAIALAHRFAVISGGPGTGKTYTVLRLMALAADQARSQGRRCRIALAAPTGKAAARMAEAVREGKTSLLGTSFESLLEAIPDEAATIHRLLGYRRNSVKFRHDADFPLTADLVIVDEASMIDLPLMSRLMQAVPEHARLVLLGDRDQLASVEAGTVLGDICSAAGTNRFSESLCALLAEAGVKVPAGEAPAPVGDQVAVLRTSRRFGQSSGIGRLAAGINAGEDPVAVVAALASGRFAPEVAWSRVTRGALGTRLRQRLESALAVLRDAPDPRAALAALGAFRVLTALRGGPFGLERVNRLVEELYCADAGIPAGTHWYHGRPVMIRENDYRQGLFNGDVGIAFEGSDGLRVHFEDRAQGLRAFLPNALPAHETAWAMTIHKSQGSEFGRVVIILPDRESELLTRELLYTAVTRAREQVDLWASDIALETAIGRRVRRASGLGDRLRGD
ncbi:MAG: exodeoxyribonuclease V subunit alpha [Gammaproteobacteria bacterium]|jgi:exodeoxyribonuclease V alpha subunit